MYAQNQYHLVSPLEGRPIFSKDSDALDRNLPHAPLFRRRAVAGRYCVAMVENDVTLHLILR